jgi:T-complex protein 1 subunit beta
MKAKVAAIAAHGINVFVNRQLVYNYPESLFAEAGIMCIEHADFEGVERRVCFLHLWLPESTDYGSLSC